MESWSGVEWSLEWSGVYFITMLFSDWNLELSWEIFYIENTITMTVQFLKSRTALTRAF